MTIADFASPQDFDCVNMVAAQTQAESHPKLPSSLKFVKGDLARDSWRYYHRHIISYYNTYGYYSYLEG